MIDKIINDVGEAVKDVKSGSLLMVGGFGDAGVPDHLCEAVYSMNLRDLTIVSNNAGRDSFGIGSMIVNGQVKRIICSYPIGPDTAKVRATIEEGKLELVLVPQGTMSERIRAAGAGLGGVLTRTGYGTEFAQGKQFATVNGTEYLIEEALKSDFSLIKAWKADKYGNLTYRGSARNFNDVMAMAGKVTVAEAEIIVDGAIPEDQVHTPGIFVDRVVQASGRN